MNLTRHQRRQIAAAALNLETPTSLPMHELRQKLANDDTAKQLYFRLLKEAQIA